MGTADSADAQDNQNNLDVLLKDINNLESLIAQWDEQQQNTYQAARCAHDELNKEAFTRLIRHLKQSPQVVALLKQALNDEIIYSVLRHHQVIKPSLDERIEDALESVRPFLQSHGGNVEVVGITLPDTVEIRLLGACDGCPASSLTLSQGVEKAIKEYCPEITHIKQAKGGLSASPTGNGVNVHFVSPFALNETDNWIHACSLEQLPLMQIKTLTINNNEVLLFRLDSQVTCYQNACAHMGMPLDMGELKGDILVCPHHGFEYSMETGECITVPEVQLQTHAVRVVDDRVEIKLS